MNSKKFFSHNNTIKKISINLVHERKESEFMESNQKINCKVASCRYHNGDEQKCTLEAITVAPMQNVKTMKADESMCASYKYEH